MCLGATQNTDGDQSDQCHASCQLLHLILIHFANLQDNNKEGEEDAEEDNEEEKDMESDPDIMDDADELQMFMFC